MPAFSHARLKRRRATSKYSFSRTRTLGIETSIRTRGYRRRRRVWGSSSACFDRGSVTRALETGCGILVWPHEKGKSDAYCAAPMRVLAIESSCDESAVAILDEERGLLAHELYSQVDLHRIYG